MHKYYGFVSGTLRAVFDSWDKVEAIRLQYPYASYKKFYSEEQAWVWVRGKTSKVSSMAVSKYGSIFKNHYVTIEYMFGDTSVYYNVNTKRMGYLKVVSPSPEIAVENRANMSLVEVSELSLNPNLIVSHLVAIHTILQIIGPYVDCEVKLPNYSVFAALQVYRGEAPYVKRTVEYIKSRLGKVAWTTYRESSAVWNPDDD